MAAPEGPAEASLPAEQHCAVLALDSSPSKVRRTASARLAELLGAAAELAAKFDAGEPSTEKITPEPPHDKEKEDAAILSPRSASSSSS
ncbi:unnamed protein product [Lampetra planeri]